MRAYKQAKTADTPETAGLVRRHRMSWEMVPAEALKAKEVWDALSGHIPINALVRNLATLTRAGVIEPMNADWAVKRTERIGGGGPRIHPLNVLKARICSICWVADFRCHGGQIWQVGIDHRIG